MKMNGIIPNLFRGVYDYKATAFSNNPKYTCVAVEMNNFISDNDNTLKKRPSFKFLYEVSDDSWLIPFNYDDNQKYLMRFFYNTNAGSGDSPDQCEFYEYINGSLLLADFGQQAFVKPTYTGNSAPQDDISDELSSASAYWHFNAYAGTSAQKAALLTPSYYWCQISFDTPVNISSINYIYGHRWGYYAATSEIAASYWQNIEVYASQDGINWTFLTICYNPEPVIGRGGYFTSPNKEILTDTYWKYYRFYPKNFAKTSTHTAPDGTSAMFGLMSIKGTQSAGATPVEAGITSVQAKSMSYSSTFRKILFAHEDFAPKQFTTSFAAFTAAGLNFGTLGNPSLVKHYQQRVLFAGYSNQIRQFNLSKAGDANIFTLNTTDVKSTDPIQGVMEEQIYKPTWAYGGRNVLYIGSNDGVFNIQGGGNQPLTATFVDAHLRMVKPCANIPIVKIEDIGYFVSSDKKTIYAFDFDYSVDRMKAVSINEHCLNLFNSGIKMLVGCKGKTDYLYALLEDGTIMAGLVNKYNEFSSATASLETESLHSWFPITCEGTILEITALQNNLTGEDTLFALIKNINDVVTIQELEKFNYTNAEYDWEDLITNGSQETITTTTGISITLDGTRNDIGKYKITNLSTDWADATKVILTDSVGRELTLTNLELADGYWYANLDTYPNSTYEYVEYTTSKFSWDNDTITSLKSFMTDNILLDNKYKVLQSNPSGYEISFDGTVNIEGKHKVSITGDVAWDDAYSIVLKTNGLEDITLTELEYVVDTWYAYIDIVPESTDVYTSYTKYKKEFEVPDALIGLDLVAYEDGVYVNTTWDDDTLITEIEMIEPIVGVKYTAEAKYANLADIRTKGVKLQVDRIGVNSVITWGVEVKTPESETSELQSFGGNNGYMQNMLLPMPAYSETIITDSHRFNKYIEIKHEMPYYCEVGYLTYNLNTGG
jgi:hypothetical protein